MKNTFILLITVLSLNYTLAQTPNTHLDMESTDKGILIPRMDSSVRNAIIPNLNEESLMVYDNDLKQFMFWDGSDWSQIGNKEQYVFKKDLNVVVGFNSANPLKEDSGKSGNFNVILGNNAVSNVDSIRNNTIVGNASGVNYKYGWGNVWVGSGTATQIDTSFWFTTIGANSGTKNKGINNAFFGSFSGQINTTGHNNSFLGYISGNKNTTGHHNTFLGSFSGRNNTTGFRNTFVGSNAGTGSTTGGRNTLLGYASGQNITSGQSNTFIGSSAGSSMKSGSSNVIVGTSGSSLDTSSNNVILGNNIGVLLERGSNNTFVGATAANTIKSGSNNLFIGTSAGGRADSLNSNMFIGTSAGFNSKKTSNNIFLGNGAGQSNISGSNNLYVGNAAGFNNKGGNNIIIGQVQTSGVGSLWNKLFIDNFNSDDPYIEGDFFNETLILRSDVTTRTIQLEKYNSSPNTCDADHEGQLYYDNSTSPGKAKLCTTSTTNTSGFEWVNLN